MFSATLFRIKAEISGTSGPCSIDGTLAKSQNTCGPDCICTNLELWQIFCIFQQQQGILRMTTF